MGKELISNLDDLSGKIPSLEENISVANQSVTEEDSIWLQNEVEVKVITETLKNKKIVILFPQNQMRR